MNDDRSSRRAAFESRVSAGHRADAVGRSAVGADYESGCSRKLMTRRAALYTLGCGALVAAASLVSFGCAPDDSTPKIDVEPIPVWTSPYDWDAVMTNTQGHLYYYPDQKLSSKFGVDVSDYDGDIDWGQVVGDGVEFAFVRVGYRGYTEGGIIDDKTFEANLEGARANGIPCGAYVFSSAINEEEAVEEANYAIGRLAGRSLEYPLVFDQEKVSDSKGRANNLTRAQFTANALAFCDRVTRAGYSPMIYGNQHQLALLDLDKLEGIPIWYAEYDVKIPTGKFDFTFWQYTGSGTIAGIGDGVDLNIQFLVDEHEE